MSPLGCVFFFPDVYAGEWWCLLSGGETINQYTRWGERAAKHLQLRTGFSIFFFVYVLCVCARVRLHPFQCALGPVDSLAYSSLQCLPSPVAAALKVQRGLKILQSSKNTLQRFTAKHLTARESKGHQLEDIYIPSSAVTKGVSLNWNVDVYLEFVSPVWSLAEGNSSRLYDRHLNATPGRRRYLGWLNFQNRLDGRPALSRLAAKRHILCFCV